MIKLFECKSRDARSFCEDLAQAKYSQRAVFSFLDVEHPNPWHLACVKALSEESYWTKTDQEPILFEETIEWQDTLGETRRDNASFWLFKNRIYLQIRSQELDSDQYRLLIMEEFDKERRHFERLQAKFSASKNTGDNRTKIPSQVRIFVWQRDSGRCVECGSNENLEYDHIIPFAKGGSNTERNLQLLCANCNRLKSDRIQ